MGFYGAVNMCDPIYPFVPFFNGMMVVLLAMNAWWFHVRPFLTLFCK